MRENVLKDEKSYEKYVNRTFTPEGIITLQTYASSLCKLYFSHNTFPYKMPPVLGIVYIKEVHEFKSKEDIKRQIMCLMQLLAIKAIEVDMGDRIEKLELEINDFKKC